MNRESNRWKADVMESDCDDCSAQLSLQGPILGERTAAGPMHLEACFGLKSSTGC